MLALDRLARWRANGQAPPVLPPPLRTWWRDLMDGHLARAVASSTAVAETLAADPATRGWVPAVVLATGAVLAGREEHLVARQYLREGLAMLPGTPSVDLVGDGSRHRLLLVELCLITGEPAEAVANAEPLTEPDHAVEVRLGATRALARLRQSANDVQGAHWLLNAATDLAAACRSRLLETVVEADRAAVLAAQGRTWEAVRMADTALDLLARAGGGPHGVLASAQAASTASSVARASALAGDPLSAERLLGVGRRAADRTGRRLPAVGVLVAQATLARVEGDLVAADAAAEAAARRAADLAAVPVEALAIAERGLTAATAGRLTSAAPLLEQAVEALARVGEPVEARRVADALADVRRAVSAAAPGTSSAPAP